MRPWEHFAFVAVAQRLFATANSNWLTIILHGRQFSHYVGFSLSATQTHEDVIFPRLRIIQSFAIEFPSCLFYIACAASIFFEICGTETIGRAQLADESCLVTPVVLHLLDGPRFVIDSLQVLANTARCM